VGNRSYISRRTPRPSFDLDGVEFHAGKVSLFRMATIAGDVDLDSMDPKDLLAIFEKLLGEDWPRFEEHVAEQVTEPSVLMQILEDLLGDVVGGPLVSPSDSASGPPPTGDTLRAQQTFTVDALAEENPTPEQLEQIRAILGTKPPAEAG